MVILFFFIVTTFAYAYESHACEEELRQLNAITEMQSIQIVQQIVLLEKYKILNLRKDQMIQIQNQIINTMKQQWRPFPQKEKQNFVRITDNADMRGLQR